MKFRVFTGPVARNPVARAIARSRVHDRLLAAKLRVAMMDAGADESEFFDGIQRTMIVVGTAIEAQYHSKDMPTDVSVNERILRGGLSALQSCATSWDPAQMMAVVRAIEATEALNKVVTTDHLYDAAVKYGMT